MVRQYSYFFNVASVEGISGGNPEAMGKGIKVSSYQGIKV